MFVRVWFELNYNSMQIVTIFLTDIPIGTHLFPELNNISNYLYPVWRDWNAYNLHNPETAENFCTEILLISAKFW